MKNIANKNIRKQGYLSQSNDQSDRKIDSSNLVRNRIGITEGRDTSELSRRVSSIENKVKEYWE